MRYEDPVERVQDKLKRLQNRTYRATVPQLFGQKYSYVYGLKVVTNSKGRSATKLFVDGPFMSRREAESRLIDLNLDQWDVHESKSRDLQRVKKEISALLVHELHLPAEVATQRKYKGA